MADRVLAAMERVFIVAPGISQAMAVLCLRRASARSKGLVLT